MGRILSVGSYCLIKSGDLLGFLEGNLELSQACEYFPSIALSLLCIRDATIIESLHHNMKPFFFTNFELP